MDFDDFIHNCKNVPKEYDKRQLYFEELRKEFIKEMKDSTENKEYFSKYDPLDVEAFILDYVDYKIQLSRCYGSYIDDVKYKDLKSKNEAEEAFMMIKQKQLFNLQLKWRSEELKLEGILCSSDFRWWGNNINECFFLPEITDYEVKLLKDYLLSEDYEAEDSIFSTSWQHYEMFFVSNFLNFNLEYPAWYRFYDERLGTGSKTLLPNIRGHKEKNYIMANYIKADIAEKKKMAKQLKNPKYVAPPEPLPVLRWTDYKSIQEFNKQFETDPHIVELFKISNSQLDNTSSMWNFKYKKHDIYNENDIPDDFIKNILNDWDDIEELVPMPEDFEWREAIIECYNKYKSKKVESYIDTIYEEYQMLRDMGISGNRTKEQLLKDMANDKSVKEHRKEILKGRKIMGEALDFNF